MSKTSTFQPQPQFLTPAEVADLLRCSVKTVRRQIERGTLKAVRHGSRVLVAFGDYLAYVHRLHVLLSAPPVSPDPVAPAVSPPVHRRPRKSKDLD